MFAPEGFVSLHQIHQELARLAADWREATPHPDDAGAEPPDFFNFNIDPGWGRETAYRDWLLQCFLNREERNLYACTPDGTPLALSEAVVRRHHFMDGPFEDEPEFWQATVDHLRDSFSYLDPIYFVISLDKLDDVIERDALGIALEVLRSLDKCPVCWKLPNSDKIDWWAICGVTTVQQNARAGGRPRKVGSVAAAYKQIFPTGHGKLTRKQVARQIEDAAGVTFHLDTLDAAIRMVTAEG